MLKSQFVRFLGLAGLILLPASGAQAVQLKYSLESTGADTWRYTYTIDNSGPSLNFDEFTVYFDQNVGAILGFTSPTSDWDNIFAQPDPGLPADGFVDALNLTGLVAPDSVISGFVVDFTYQPGLTPGAQPYELLDTSLATYPEAVYSGLTVPISTNSVPEPDSLALVMLGLSALGFGFYRSARNTKRAGFADKSIG